MPNSFVFNPLDEQTRRDPYDTYCAARRTQRIYIHPGLGAASVFRYEDCESVLRDPTTWSNAFPQPDIEGTESFGPPGMIGTDPPEHSRLRGLVNVAFTPRIIRQREARIRQIADELVESAIQEGSVDLVEALTYPLPTMVIAEIIGIPPEDRAQFKQWSDEIIATVGHGLIGQPPAPDEIDASIKRRDKMSAYFDKLADLRRAEPLEDLLSGLVRAEIDGSQLDPDELLSMLILLLVAGNETTTTLIGNCVVTLLEHPDQLERLRADPNLVPSAVEEVLRFSSPVQVDPRCASRDIELHGEKICKDQILLCWLGAANRDADVFERPEEFDIGRRENRHLAFGFGTHFCLGSNLARLEAQIAVRTLLEKTKDFELATDTALPLHPSFVFRSFTQIPLKLTA
ncbi:MAG: cytochrome P450 [Myxococcota bacterium]